MHLNISIFPDEIQWEISIDVQYRFKNANRTALRVVQVEKKSNAALGRTTLLRHSNWHDFGIFKEEKITEKPHKNLEIMRNQYRFDVVSMSTGVIN